MSHAAEVCPFKVCHLESQFSKNVSASFTFSVNAPSLRAREWIFFAPLPPNLESQQELSTWIFLLDNNSYPMLDIREHSKMQRHVLQARISAYEEPYFSQLKTQTRYRLNLYSRSLVEGASSVEVQDDKEKTKYLDDTKTLNFKSPQFQKWLKNHNLFRAKSERQLDFAWRSYLEIRQFGSYVYISNQDRSVSKICRDGRTDCGGFSALFASTMRANGIPARLLVGRWLKKDNKTDSEDNGFGECHVKSEFYIDGIGWIPVEMSAAVSDKQADPKTYFGKFGANFVTLHVDPDLILNTIYFGFDDAVWLQAPQYWVTGEGKLDGATINNSWQATKNDSNK